MAREYLHELNTEVRTIAGWYQVEKEDMVIFDNRILLYLVGNAVLDCSCCGIGGCRYAVVPGYVLKFRARKNLLEQWISEVEPVVHSEQRWRISCFLKEKEFTQQVQFW
jgi:hypothetical protein